MSAVGLEHGTFAVVGHGLRDLVIRLDVVDGAVGRGHGRIEDVQVFERLAAGVVVPIRIVGRPQRRGGKEPFEFGNLLGRRAGARLGVEAEGATSL